MQMTRALILPALGLSIALGACSDAGEADTLSSDERQQLDRAAEMLETRDSKPEIDDGEPLPPPFESE